MTSNEELLSAIAKTTFRLNGQILALGERLARPAGLTAASWQVLGAVLGQPRSVAEVARAIGVTRQNVQRIADGLVERGLARYEPNPAHRRAKLLAPTARGHMAVRHISPARAEAADRLATSMGRDELRRTLAALQRLSAAMDAEDGFRSSETSRVAW